MVKISIIMPVYNAEAHLAEAIGSVTSQTFEDFELICIDDGSADASAEILDEFSARDSRIKVISQDNNGAGFTRNRGIESSSGDYIFFMDADDYIVPEFLESVYANITSNDSDIATFKIGNIENGKKVKRWPYFPFDNVFGDVDFDDFTFSYKSVKRYVLNASFAPWMKFYKREFLDSFDDFVFDETLPYEDVLFHVKVMLRASKISFVPQYLYYYRLDSADSCTANQEDHIEIFKIIDIVGDFLKSNNYLDEFKKEYEFFKVTQTTHHISDEIDENYFKKAKDYLKDINVDDNDAIPLNLKERYNVFFSSDDALTYRKNIKIQMLLERQSELEHINEELVNENQALKKRRDYHKNQKDALESSTSWKVTRIFRWITNLFR